MKKFLSIILSFLMIASVFSTTVSAYASYDSIDTAKPIEFNTTYNSSLSESNKKDYYKFKTTTTGYVELNATNYNDDVYASYSVYDKDGNKVWWSDINKFDYNRALGYSIGTAKVYLLAGTYYLKSEAESISRQYGEYNFSLKFTDAKETSSISEDQYSRNNTIGTAFAINTDTNYTGVLCDNDDTDFYRFSVTSSGTCTLSVKAYIQTYAFFEVFDFNGKSLGWNDVFDYDSNYGYAKGTYSFPVNAGTYYIKTSTEKYADRVGIYNFILKFSNKSSNSNSDETPSNNSDSTSAPDCSNYSSDSDLHTPVNHTVKTTNNKTGYWEVVCKVCGKNLSNGKHSIPKPSTAKVATEVYYKNGKARKPVVTLYNKNGKKMINSNNEGVTVKYNNNKNIGIATAVVTINDIYYDNFVITTTFMVRPPKTSINKLTSKKTSIKINWKKQTKLTDGYQYQCYCEDDLVECAMDGGSPTVYTVKGKNKTGVTVKGLEKNTKYTVKVRTYKTVKGKKIYSGWSTKTIKTK